MIGGRRWRAPAWLCPDLLGIADPEPRPRALGTVELHREQYVSRHDAERYLHYMHPIAAGNGWATALKEENHPGDIPLQQVRVHASLPGEPVRSGRAQLGWPDDVVGVLLTPGGFRLDRGALEHPKKRLRETPTRILHSPAGWRGIAGDGSDLILLVPHAPTGSGYGLHRIARTVRRDGGAARATLLLRTGRDGQRFAPGGSVIDEALFVAERPASRIVRLTRHDGGRSLQTTRRPDVVWGDSDGVRRPLQVLDVSVRDDLLEDVDIDAVAAEVSVALLEPTGLLLGGGAAA
jgi:hypothetical protein